MHDYTTAQPHNSIFTMLTCRTPRQIARFIAPSDADPDSMNSTNGTNSIIWLETGLINDWRRYLMQLLPLRLQDPIDASQRDVPDRNIGKCVDHRNQTWYAIYSIWSDVAFPHPNRYVLNEKVRDIIDAQPRLWEIAGEAIGIYANSCYADRYLKLVTDFTSSQWCRWHVMVRYAMRVVYREDGLWEPTFALITREIPRRLPRVLSWTRSSTRATQILNFMRTHRDCYLEKKYPRPYDILSALIYDVVSQPNEDRLELLLRPETWNFLAHDIKIETVIRNAAFHYDVADLLKYPPRNDERAFLVSLPDLNIIRRFWPPPKLPREHMQYFLLDLHMAQRLIKGGYAVHDDGWDMIIGVIVRTGGRDFSEAVRQEIHRTLTQAAPSRLQARIDLLLSIP